MKKQVRGLHISYWAATYHISFLPSDLEPNDWGTRQLALPHWAETCTNTTPSRTGVLSASLHKTNVVPQTLS